MKIATIACAIPALVTLAAVPAMAAPCDTTLAALKLKDAKITSVQMVPAGSFTEPGNRQARGENPYKALPDFCRVAATLTPSSDSDIKVEVWLPANGWNGKFQAVGNGGWAGTISYSVMAEAVARGYASASTDTGHEGGRGTFALGHPEKLVDFAWRSEHEMTVKAKDVIKAYYGSAPKLSYWNGCSTGGRQGLKMAQMFPNDFDGIVAGAPANRTAISLWIADAVLKDKASYIPPAKYPAIHTAAVNACDANDGLKDGLITDPTSCRFDPGVMLCKQGDSASCLTAPQVAAAKKIYGPALHPRTGKEMFGSLVPGTELGWGVQAEGPEPSANSYDQYRYVVFKDEKWDWKTFDFDKDLVKGDAPENLIMNATNPDMKAFFGHGGKLLLYHGWSDPNVATVNTVSYYKQVVEVMGGAKKASESVRLFLEPGMGHCRGGDGPNEFDKMAAIEQWVEQGKAPETMLATQKADGKVIRTRPLCPYPQVAKYRGTGSIDEAANFSCVAP